MSASRKAKEYVDDEGGETYPNRSPHDTKGTIEVRRPVRSPEFPSPLYSLFSFSNPTFLPRKILATNVPPSDRAWVDLFTANKRSLGERS